MCGRGRGRAVEVTREDGGVCLGWEAVCVMAVIRDDVGFDKGGMVRYEGR